VLKQKPLSGNLLDYGEPLTQGLVGYWLMNEGSGNKVYDLSGNGFQGTEQQDAIWQPGDTGPARYFGGNDYIDCGDPGSFFSTELTVIVKWYVSGVQAGRISAWGLFNNANSAYAFRKDANANVRYGIATQTLLLGGHTAGQWYTSAISYKQNEWGRIYRNGILIGNLVSYSLAIPTGTYNLCIGAESTPGLYFTDGLVEYLYLFNRALSASEIERLYQEPSKMIRTRPRRIIAPEDIAAAVTRGGAVYSMQEPWGARIFSAA
jgi:hypothetical protein